MEADRCFTPKGTRCEPAEPWVSSRSLPAPHRQLVQNVEPLLGAVRSMHHRAQIMFLMEKVGLKEHIEGNLLSWESNGFGWG